MRALVGNMVKTEVADYPCATREEAEALYLTLRRRQPARGEDVGAGEARELSGLRRKPPHRAR